MYSLTNAPSSETIEDCAVSLGYVWPMELNQRIFLAREEAGLTQQQLANAVGKTRGAVAQWEAGDVRPRHSTLVAIAKATGKDLVWLEAGVGSDQTGLLVVGEVAAGMWREGTVTFKPYGQPVAPHPDYPAHAQRLYRVSGTSLNKKVQDGEYLHTVDIHAGNLRAEDGDLVIVRRMEHGLTEYTAKTLVRSGDKWVLRPESTDPQWSEDIELSGHEETEISVTDIVIAKWSPLGRRSK